MNKPALWALSLLITLLFAVFQRVTGPTYPVKGEGTPGSGVQSYRLPRSCTSGAADCVVRASCAAPLTGRVEWRRRGTDEPAGSAAMAYSGGTLSFQLPDQPPAGKLEYRVFVGGPDGETQLGGKTVVTRFKGAVPPWALVPHVVFIFLFMFFSVRIALGALLWGESLRHPVAANLAFLLLGGFVFGPVVQYYAFGQAWTGFPFGYDLTDNKTLLMLLAWLPALRAALKGRQARVAVLAAFAVTAAVYLVPHSLFGSELDYASGKVVTGN